MILRGYSVVASASGENQVKDKISASTLHCPLNLLLWLQRRTEQLLILCGDFPSGLLQAPPLLPSVLFTRGYRSVTELTPSTAETDSVEAPKLAKLGQSTHSPALHSNPKTRSSPEHLIKLFNYTIIKIIFRILIFTFPLNLTLSSPTNEGRGAGGGGKQNSPSSNLKQDQSWGQWSSSSHSISQLVDDDDWWTLSLDEKK